MLEKIYYWNSVIQELRCGPLGSHIDDFATYLLEVGYMHDSLQSRLAVVRSLSQWLSKKKWR
jgi:hypothetical protein